MKKIVPLLLLLALFMSCATIPVPKSEEDTLTFIPYHSEDVAGRPIFGHYVLGIYEQGQDKLVKTVTLTMGKEYSLIRNLPEGQYYVAYMYFQYDDGYHNRDGKTKGEKYYYEPIDTTFHVKNGHLSIAPIQIIQLYQLRGGTWTMMIDWQFDQNGAIADDLYNLLMNRNPEEISAWERL